MMNDMDTLRARLASIAQNLDGQRNKFSNVKHRLDAINFRDATLASCCSLLDHGNYENRSLGETIQEISSQLGIYDKKGRQEVPILQERSDGYKIQAEHFKS
jgi:hypothetical protein